MLVPNRQFRSRTYQKIRILAFTILLATTLGSTGCDENTIVDPPSGRLSPAYIIEQGTGGGHANLFGWAELHEALPETFTEGSTFRARYALPERPYKSFVSIELERTAGVYRYDWTLGPPGGEVIRGRIEPEVDEGWAELQTGWGDLSLQRGLAPAGTRPIVFDPYSPLSFALLAWHWDEAGRPASMNLDLLFLPDPDARVQSRAAFLDYEGDGEEDSYAVLSFRLDLPAQTDPLALVDLPAQRFFFDTFTEDFPAPLNTWWDQRLFGLRFWGDSPPSDLSDLAFDPRFPAPENYTVNDTLVSGPAGDIALERLYPTEQEHIEEPYSGVLFVSDWGPRDRDDAALFGFLSHEFARRGWLVHRYDKAGTGASMGDLDALDLADRRQALAILWQQLLSDAKVDPERCMLIGHGEGAVLALELAAQDPRVAGVATLAPPFLQSSQIPVIPELGGSGDYVTLLGLSCFADKYRDLMDLDSADYLPQVLCPVALYLGSADGKVSGLDLQHQVDLLPNPGGRVLGWDPRDDPQRIDPFVFADLSHDFTYFRADEAPDAGLVNRLTAWSELFVQEAP